MRVASTANASSLLRMLSSPRALRPCETVCSQVRILSSEPALVGQCHASPQRNGTVQHIAVSPLSARQGPGTSVPCRLLPHPSPEVRMPLVPADISRREFLELGAAAGLACATSAGCRTGVPAATTRGLAGPAIPPFALQEATIADLRRGCRVESTRPVACANTI